MQKKRTQLACEFLQSQSSAYTFLLLAPCLRRPALRTACCFLRTNGWELTLEELDRVLSTELRVFEGRVQQVAENLSETDSMFKLNYDVLLG